MGVGGSQPVTGPSEPSASERLDSWKEIAAYLKRDESTVRRWEKEGLPVRRHPHKSKASIYAYKSEVDAWWSNGRPRLEAAETTTTVPHRRAGFPPAVVVGIVLLALLAGGLTWNVAGLRDRLFGRPVAGQITSIAVLPLENLTGDSEQEYLADGITEALTTELAQIGALHVISRTSAMQYKGGKKKPLPEIARELNVEGVVEGALVRSGNRVQVTIQLIEARTDRHLWARRFERDLTDILLLQNELTAAIAGQLRVKLTPQEQARQAKARAVKPDAYEAYLKGKYHTVRGIEDHFKKVEYFQRAIDLDPAFAPAWQGLGNAYWSLGLGSWLPPRQAYPKARAAVLKALELDDTLAEAHATLGRINYLYEWDWQGAEREFARARGLDQSWPGPTNYWTLAGRFDEAIAGLKHAIERDPLSPSASQNLGWGYFMARRYDEAITQLKKALEMDPRRHQPHLLLAWSYSKKGMHDDAVAQCGEALGMAGQEADQSLMGDCGWIYGVAGRRQEALKLMQRIRALAPRRWMDPLHIASIYDGLGDTDRAIQFLYQAYEERSPRLVHLRVFPLVTDRLRSDQRFQDLLRRVGLPTVKAK